MRQREITRRLEQLELRFGIPELQKLRMDIQDGKEYQEERPEENWLAVAADICYGPRIVLRINECP